MFFFCISTGLESGKRIAAGNIRLAVGLQSYRKWRVWQENCTIKCTKPIEMSNM